MSRIDDEKARQNGFSIGIDTEEIYPPCAHKRLISETCGNIYCRFYEKSCKMYGATQRKCKFYKECMPLEAYRNQFKD